MSNLLLLLSAFVSPLILGLSDTTHVQTFLRPYVLTHALRSSLTVHVDWLDKEFLVIWGASDKTAEAFVRRADLEDQSHPESRKTDHSVSQTTAVQPDCTAKLNDMQSTLSSYYVL